MTLVTLDQFKRQLGVAGLPTDDALLTMKLEQATALVIDYIRRSDDADASGADRRLGVRSWESGRRSRSRRMCRPRSCNGAWNSIPIVGMIRRWPRPGSPQATPQPP